MFNDHKNKTVECLQVLIDGGADVNATMDDESYNGENMTALHFPIMKCKSCMGSWE